MRLQYILSCALRIVIMYIYVAYNPSRYVWRKSYPDSKIPGANMGPTWVLSAPDGPHVGSRNLVIRVSIISDRVSHVSPPTTYPYLLFHIHVSAEKQNRIYYIGFRYAHLYVHPFKQNIKGKHIFYILHIQQALQTCVNKCLCTLKRHHQVIHDDTITSRREGSEFEA